MSLKDGAQLSPESDENMSQDALKYLKNRELFNIYRPLTMDDIRYMHVFIAEHYNDGVHESEGRDNDIRAGDFRHTSMIVYGSLAACPPKEIEAEMTKFIEWLAAKERESR